MPKRWRHAVVAVGLMLSVRVSTAADAPPDETAQVFGATKIWKVEIRVSPEAWKEMQPEGGPQFGFPGGGPPGGRPPGGPGAAPGGGPPGPPGGPPGTGRGPRPGTPAFRPGSFGYEFEYVKGDISFDGETLKNVGVRFKGNGTYMASQAGNRRPFKIDFDRFEDGLDFHGLKTLNLLNNVMDPTRLRQTLSYEVFADAGVPSPRTSFAEVTLTVDGQIDHEFLGLYSVVEEIDKGFLKRHYANDKGMLLKPEGTQGIEHKGDNWSDYEWFGAKGKPTKAQQQRLIELTRLVANAEDDEFAKQIGEYVDLDEAARFLAANVLLSNLDSFLTHVHNYYVYLPTETNKFVLLPWDMDLSMGAFFLVGSPEQLRDLSIAHPHQGKNRFLDRILALEEFDSLYCQHLKELAEAQFGPEGAAVKSLATLREAIAASLEKEKRQEASKPKPPGPGFPSFGAGPSLDEFMSKRLDSIRSQLAGTSKGFEPRAAFGPPGSGFGPGMFLAQPLRNAVDDNKDGKLTLAELSVGAQTLFTLTGEEEPPEFLTDKTFAIALQKALPPPPRFPGAGDPPPPPPPGEGPIRFLSDPVFRKADADGDGKVALEEMLRVLGDVFAKADADKSNDLNEKEVSKAFQLVYPAPGGTPPGPPGGNPPAR
jgi:hypothetical protein